MCEIMEMENKFSKIKSMRRLSKKGLVGLIGLISAASILLFIIFVFLLSSATVPKIVSAVTCPANKCCANCTSWPHSCYYSACYYPYQCQLTGNNCPAGTRPNITVWTSWEWCYSENRNVLVGGCNCDCIPVEENPPGGCTEYCPYGLKFLYASCFDGFQHIEYASGGAECRRNWYPFSDVNCNNKKLTAIYYHHFHSAFGSYIWWDTSAGMPPENPAESVGHCSDGHDNDCDGRIDMNDTDCDSTSPTVTLMCKNNVTYCYPDEGPGNCSCAGGTCIRNHTGSDTIYVVLDAQDPSGGGGLKEVRYCLVSGNIWGTSGPNMWNDPASGIANETAEYDPAFGAPSCVTGGSPCIAPDSLIESKDGGVPWQFSSESPFYPPEKNAPNTIDNCIDWGNTSNSTVESIKVWVNDADKTINQGNVLNYEIKYYCGCGYAGCSQAQMCIFYTNNANSPSWGQPIKSQTCSGTGEQKVTGTITLTGSSSYHAIRGFIRDPKGSGYATGPCDGGNLTSSSPADQLYADFDDLAFYVAPSSGTCTPTILLQRNTYCSDWEGGIELWNKYYLIHDENSTVNYKSWDYARNSVSGQYTAKLQQITAPPPSGVNPTPPYFIIRKGSSSNKALVGSNGAMNITGTKNENQGSITPSGDDFVVKNSAGVVKAMIDGTTGNLYLAGTVNENQASLSPSGSGNFIIKSSAGEVVAYFDSGGNLWLKKTLNQNSPVNP
jgi:hypothetical protein